ncbi:uncharacterized protein [Fopius arisanus]|uniref:Uncharacterized protein isoform X2 n=2 Tax=Fopius arisanus TaxID=64838 RepID=A0A9R1UAY4_9HYME|nr:PREDICTED: uncharacterized protein LOC105273807 isoform X2 [Fopius arisanus]
MNTVLQIALILLTLAGPLLTEERHRGAKIVSIRHSPRHHHQEQPIRHPLKMQKHLTPDDDKDDNKDFQPYEAMQKDEKDPKKPIPVNEYDDDDDDEDEDDDDNDRPDHRHQRSHWFDIGWDQRTRLNLKYNSDHHRSRTRVSSGVKPTARGHHRHHHHHSHHEHPLSTSSRNSWSNGNRKLGTPKTWSRRKSWHKNYDDDDDMDGDDGYGRGKTSERKWRSDDLKESIKDDDDEDIWKELEQYGLADITIDKLEGSNDDYYEDISDDEEKPPYMTYEEIIKRLTQEEDRNDNRISTKRKNTKTQQGIEMFLTQDVYGNFMFNGTNFPVVLKEKTKQEVSEERKGQETKKGNIPELKSSDSDYGDAYDDVEGYVDEEEAGELSRSTVIQVYPLITTAPDYKTQDPIGSAPTLPVKTSSRLNITINIQKPYDGHNNTTISQENSHNGLRPMRSGQKYATRELTSSRPDRNNAGMTRAAIQHARKVLTEGKCQWPRARIIPVQKFYADASVTYIPRCVILHRCSDDTGCCGSDIFTCIPKQYRPVELSFFVDRVGGPKTVQKLSFHNHTECQCIKRHWFEENTMNKLQGKNHEIQLGHDIGPSPQNKTCRCPAEFTPRITSDGECQCKCFESNTQCVFARKGKVFFSVRDRICIQKKECAMPTCEFGEYIMDQGRCPKKRDKIDAITNYPGNNDHSRQ